VFLIPFFLVAATVPLVTQYFVDSYGWTGVNSGFASLRHAQCTPPSRWL